jgi:hypothetical protein
LQENPAVSDAVFAKTGPEIGWAIVDWINLARERKQQRVLVNMVIRQQGKNAEVAALIYLHPMMWYFLCF